MRVTTQSGREYLVVDLGDGAILVSGHPKFCPTPSLAELCGPIQEGKPLFFRVKTGEYKHLGHRIMTTTVTKILVD